MKYLNGIYGSCVVILIGITCPAISADDQKEDRKRQPGGLGLAWKAADQLLINGQFFGILTRPVSSSMRLFNSTADSGQGLLLAPMSISRNIPLQPLSNEPGMDLVKWEERLDSLVGKKGRPGTIDFLIGGQEYFDRLVKRLNEAQHSVQLRMFIFDNDDYAVEIADLLKEKSKQGVKVQVLLDGVGIVMGETKMPESLPPGFNPPSSMKEYLLKDSKIEVRVTPSTWLKADHTKTVVIDEKVGFTGGMNIGREYRYEWHDMMMEVGGPVLADIIRDFELAWVHASALGDLGYMLGMLQGRTISVEGDGPQVRLLYTRPGDPQILKAQLAAIHAAQKYIYIHNSYLSDNLVLTALIKARRRGVDVKVILPDEGNHQIMNGSNMVTVNVMLRNGIEVYLYPGMSHIKAAVFDGWLCAGSANFDHLSLRDNLEMNVATSDPQLVKQLEEKLFAVDFAKSQRLTEPLKTTVGEYIAEFLANQL